MASVFKTNFREVDFFYPKTRLGLVLLALLFSTQLLPVSVVEVISIILIVTIGLMHGATDHILYVNSAEKRPESKVPKGFIVRYLVVLLTMGLIWFLLPRLALVIFLIVSAYHFGQTQLQYLPISEKSLLKKVLYLLWGLLVLAIIVLTNIEESKALVYSVIPSINLDILESEFNFQIILVTGLFVIGLMFIASRRLAKVFLALELIEVLSIALLSSQVSLLVTFGVFFGLWHSLRASQVQVDKIAKVTEYSRMSFIKDSLPFTLVSIFGISLILFLANRFDLMIRVEMLFLVAVSMLTMPHIFIYESFYNRFDPRNRK